MPCKRCQSDIQPANFGSPRRCAFLESGEFNADNWNCAKPCDPDELVHFETNGWIIMTRYKHRGETSGALHIMWNGSEPLNLQLAERVIAAYANLKKPRKP